MTMKIGVYICECGPNISEKVDIVTKSYKEGSKAVKWSCDGSPEYTIEEVEKAERGTDIVLHIDDEKSREFAV